MMDALNQFHFLRPWGLLFVIAGMVLVPLWRWLGRHQDAITRMIAPHLLPHLSLPAGERARFRPVHGTALLLVLTGLALTGPTWTRTVPPFADEQTRVTIIIDLSESMDTNGMLALAQDRVQTLAERHPGWYIGLIGYARSAHRVLPDSRDRDLLALYLNSLEAGMIPGHGRNLAAALAIADETTQDSRAPRTLLVFTDNLAGIQPHPEPLREGLDLLVLAPGKILSAEWAGSPLQALQAEARSFTTTAKDMNWLESRIQSHFKRQQSLDDALKWKDLGYWLVWPALIVCLVSIRRGWRLSGLTCILPWCLIPLALLTAPISPASAGELADAFLTPDQQGRLAFESDDYAKAANAFRDPYLRGLSAYRAADFKRAIENFRQLDTSQAWFYLGNTYARTLELDKAKIAYQTALEKDPGLAAAEANLALVSRLAGEVNEARAKAPDIGADEVRFDNDSDQGDRTILENQQAMTADIWLENLNTSATAFLKRKFAGEQRKMLGEQP